MARSLLIILILLFGVSGCSAGEVPELGAAAPPPSVQPDIMGSPTFTYKWTVLSKVGVKLYARFHDDYPYAFDDQGNLLTAAEMDKLTRDDGSPVVLQDIGNAVRQMYFKLAKDKELPGERPNDIATHPSDLPPPKP